MESVKDIMKRLGFEENGSESVAAAFVKNLISQAYGVSVEIPQKFKEKDQRPQSPQQLIFDLDDAG
mgnify:CR=1 FL=1